MKYKKLTIVLNITVRGIPNGEKSDKLLYHFQGNPSMKGLRKIVSLIGEWYPENKNKEDSQHE